MNRRERRAEQRLKHYLEVLGKLSPEERLLCIWKRAGFSSDEIAEHYGRPVTLVDSIFSTAKRKLRQFLREAETKKKKNGGRVVAHKRPIGLRKRPGTGTGKAR